MKLGSTDIKRNLLRQATLIAAHLGRGVALLFIVFGMCQVIAGKLGTGLWIAFIDWFLETAARAEVRRRETLDWPTRSLKSPVMPNGQIVNGRKTEVLESE